MEGSRSRQKLLIKGPLSRQLSTICPQTRKTNKLQEGILVMNFLGIPREQQVLGFSAALVPLDLNLELNLDPNPPHRDFGEEQTLLWRGRTRAKSILALLGAGNS